MFQTSNVIGGYSIPFALVYYSLRFSDARWCYNDQADSIFHSKDDKRTVHRKIKTKLMLQQNKQSKTKN